MTVWLYDTRGPERHVCGVTDDETRARRLARESLRSVDATAALVEQAYAALELKTLLYVYQRTGQGWHGVRQFLDVGSGLPTRDNTHQAAQAVDESCRVVYVDNDPIVLVHAQARLAAPEWRPFASAFIRWLPPGSYAIISVGCGDEETGGASTSPGPEVTPGRRLTR
jgi:hypothetical protein